MFVALYEMVAKPGRELAFESAWAEVTDAIYRVRGSFGSRLHRSENPRTYVAYAQWPSRTIYENNQNEGQFTKEEREAVVRMKEAAEQIKTLHLMDVLDDRFKPVQ